MYSIISILTLSVMKHNKSNKVATFDKVLGLCNAQGEVYNPSQESIKVAALNSLLTTAGENLKAADVSRTAYENALNARQPVFRYLPKLATRIVDALRASGAPQEAVDDAAAISRRFRSQKKVLVSSSEPVTLADGTVTTEEKYRRRLSQLDKATMVHNFQSLIIRVGAEPSYNPNETELKAESLNQHLETLATMNRDVTSAFIAMKNDIHELNHTLGIMYQTVKDVKAYFRSVFGRTGEKYKEIVQLKFRKS